MLRSCAAFAFTVTALLMAAPATANGQKPAAVQLGAAEQTAVFKAAGFRKQGRQWKSDCGDPGTETYGPGAIETPGDLNGDGRPEAIVTEGGTYCYGMTGTAFWLLSKQGNGTWKLIYNATGIPEFLKTKGVGSWPDISVGGPGFCFPVVRWNGKEYRFHRRAYEGKPCKG